MSVKRGEIIRIKLNPTSGREQQGEARPCLVISNTKFNQKREIAIVLPITNTVKPKIKTLIPLSNNLAVTGSVDTEQVRSLDLQKRRWKSTGVILEEADCDRIVKIFSVLIS